MDSKTLDSFRHQLATWTESRLDSGRYAFRRVETRPAIFCSEGVEKPDLVLWINRASGQAGGIILLPTRQDSTWIERGRKIAHALGLKHFVLWEAHEISIWVTYEQDCHKLEILHLPPAETIVPSDFEQTLDQLLDKLKLLAVTGTAASKTLPPHYFANLCEMTRQNLLPGQAEASRLAADGTQSDSWTAHVSIAKTWLTLWRVLFLLSSNRLPPSLQPHRLEHAMGYVLAETDVQDRSVFAIEGIEPGLTEAASICFHHLANRLQQLDWSTNTLRAAQTVQILLDHCAAIFKISTEEPPWPADRTDLAVNYALPIGYNHTRLVAPRAYLTGWNLLARLSGMPAAGSQARTVYEMWRDVRPENSAAHLLDESIPSRDACKKRLLALREVWPNHRFSLPRDTPNWLWEALYLAGLSSPAGNLHLCLPTDWAFAPGADILWRYLSKGRHLRSYGQSGQSGQTGTRIQFGEPHEDDGVDLLRPDGQMRISSDLAPVRHPRLLHFCLKCEQKILSLLLEGRLRPSRPEPADVPDEVARAAGLFFHSTVGQHVWLHQSGEQEPPGVADMNAILAQQALLLPAADVLGAFALLDWQPGQAMPDRGRLDRTLLACWGRLPAVQVKEQTKSGRKIRQASRQNLHMEIAGFVFRDGLPLFPDHYLMQHYRPELRRYDIIGPLEYQDSFFGRVSLRAADGSEIEVANEPTAKALRLLSGMKRATVELPVDPALMEQILDQYLADLERLWNILLRECRRRIPARRQALASARKIWKEHQLPRRDQIEKL